ncbi:MAG TPA: hypothetical protein VL051_09575 [Burkholderiaceae bacterium]|nr:hypothetical protein [Burkholderiaceae bacterium]
MVADLTLQLPIDPATPQWLALLRREHAIDAIALFRPILEHLLAQIRHHGISLARGLLVKLAGWHALLMHLAHQIPLLATEFFLELHKLRALLADEIRNVAEAIASHHPGPIR